MAKRTVDPYLRACRGPLSRRLESSAPWLALGSVCWEVWEQRRNYCSQYAWAVAFDLDAERRSGRTEVDAQTACDTAGRMRHKWPVDWQKAVQQVAVRERAERLTAQAQFDGVGRG